MFWSEEVGLISKSDDQENSFCWTLPHCIAYSDVVCSPFFSSYNTKWRMALIRIDATVGLFLWKIEGNYYCLSDLTVKLGIKELQEKTITGELNTYGCFGKWDFDEYHMFFQKREELAADGFLRFFCEIRSKTETPCEMSPRSKFVSITEIQIFMLH